MAAKKSKKIRAPGEPATLRRVRESEGKVGASFPVPPSRLELPSGYAKTLREIKRRIREERLRVVMSANSAMVLLYWDIGRMILERQRTEGWGAKVIDRLGWDLSQSYPDMRGLSARNLKYMRAFAAAWPDRAIVQEPLAQLADAAARGASGLVQKGTSPPACDSGGASRKARAASRSRASSSRTSASVRSSRASRTSSGWLSAYSRSMCRGT
ncbi:MAG TPA: DUF1016 N-terminal domain-containing protein [Polyangiaceae bacterium]